jgi:hypothetical protein
MVCSPRCRRRRHCRRCAAAVATQLSCCLRRSASATAAIPLRCRRLPRSAANFVVMPPLPPPCRRLHATVAVPLPRWCCRSAAANTALLLPRCRRCQRPATANTALLPPHCRRCPAPASTLLLPPSYRHRRCCATAATTTLLWPLPPMSCHPATPLIDAAELPLCAHKQRPAAATLPPSTSRCPCRRHAAHRCRAAAALLPLLFLRCHRAAAANTAHLPP